MKGLSDDDIPAAEQAAMQWVQGHVWEDRRAPVDVSEQVIAELAMTRLARLGGRNDEADEHIEAAKRLLYTQGYTAASAMAELHVLMPEARRIAEPFYVELSRLVANPGGA